MTQFIYFFNADRPKIKESPLQQKHTCQRRYNRLTQPEIQNGIPKIVFLFKLSLMCELISRKKPAADGFLRYAKSKKKFFK